MKAELFEKCLDLIPDIVADIVEWNTPKTQEPRRMYREIVDYFTPNNICTRHNSFLIDEEELLDHIERARKQWDCSIDEASDTQVVIRRTSTSGNYVIATYSPTKSSAD